MRNSEKKDANQFKAMEVRENAKEKINRHIRTGIVIFSLLLVYILFFAYQLLTMKQIKSVTVEAGVLEESVVFDAMVIRQESNVYAAESGIMDIFLPAGATAKKGEAVCSVTHDFLRRNQILASLNSEKERLSSAIEYDPQTQKELQAYFREYAVNNNYHKFDYTNQILHELENMMASGSLGYTVSDSGSYQKSLDNLELYRQQIESIGKTYRVSQSSTISYSMDGLEEITSDSFQLSDLNKQAKVINRLENKEVKEKDFLFKNIDNLYFYLGAEINGVTYSYLEKQQGSFIRLFFPSKNLSMTVRLIRLEQQADSYLAVFQAERFINRFLEERFLPAQITYNQYSGLKIPNSAISSKMVWVIPKTAVDINERGDYFVRKKAIDEKKQETAVFVRIKVYGENDGQYLVLPVDDPNELQKGDILLNLLPEKANEYADYTIGQEEKILGVYVLNKGYADFKRIHRLYQSDHFSIVKKFFPYSIKIYDQIAGEAQNLKEFSVIK